MLNCSQPFRVIFYWVLHFLWIMGSSINGISLSSWNTGVMLTQDSDTTFKAQLWGFQVLPQGCMAFLIFSTYIWVYSCIFFPVTPYCKNTEIVFWPDRSSHIGLPWISIGASYFVSVPILGLDLLNLDILSARLRNKMK